MSYSPPSSAKPFTLNIPEQDLSEWRQLLQLSKLSPDTYEGRQEDRRFGITRKWLSDAKEYWLNEYDWRAEEKYINSFANYKMQIEEIDLHFLAIFSEKKDAIPIVFMHGWPGSFIEFLPICALIREQYSAKDLPYHIIVPSLPGYTLSSGGPVDKNWTMEDTARVINQLMLNLNFDRYIAQGGDIGSFESRLLAQEYDACVGMHLNMMRVADKPDESTLSTLEKNALDYATKWQATGTAYAQEHATRPSTIGHVLSSSPLALLSWIGEKFVEWSDTDPPLSTILTNISLYWFTSSFPRSIYPYRQIFVERRPRLEFCKKPTGFSFFPRELAPGIKSVLEKNCNLVSYSTHEHGGHFAALEMPKELWSDVEEFVKLAWKKV
ncbi:epoxide hydrolase-like protein [Dothidotthia symphoricarpi CBS 119687]|uniref:Epoxide hydrolase-like protein n=1 Tax=Dothidotthia symphoricarpi CBS 119687 TaxID=1392245 RepID=A0A6A6ABE0_9PLEO|nr:epoxide hydrolase-like protein [Dothidotthia symphoricarpi CBS 119687]KAF2128177.1 epoxide hydrolase-like protein [Dothidotthia symphoricarpi CBS 119687]